jgi:class 3 adenylate cyclase/TolB-like protein/Flp pilus assembly protein TadD
VSVSPVARRLSAILSADIAGFSRLMAADEAGAHRTLRERRAALDAEIAGHGGRIVGTAGDSVLAEFASVVDAVACAVEAQRRLAAPNLELPPAQRMAFRMGINLGDVIVDGSDLFGDGVNVAARLQALAAAGGLCVSQAVWEQVHAKLPYRWRDLGAQRLKNIAEPVHVFAWRDEATGADRPTRRLPWLAPALAVSALAAAGLTAVWLRHAQPPAPESGRPTIVVLPFANQSGDPSQAYFSEGVSEDVTAALGRFSSLAVVSSQAAASFRGPEADFRQAAAQLGARYVLRGSVRREGARVRVSAQLADPASGLQLWSDRAEGVGGDLFQMQDAIVRGVVGALAVQISRIEEQRAAEKQPDSLDAYDWFLRGRRRMPSTTQRENEEARAAFERALALAPNYAAAYAGMGFTRYEQVASGWTEFRDETLSEAERLAQKALSLDPMLVEGYLVLGAVNLNRAEYDRAISDLDRALELNPSQALAHAFRGGVLMWSGRTPEAVAALETAIRFDPGSPTAAMNLGFAYYLSGRYEDAVRALEHGHVRESTHVLQVYRHVALAATYAQLGRDEDAALARSALLRLNPFFEIEAFVRQFRDPRQGASVGEGLAKAGLS